MTLDEFMEILESLLEKGYRIWRVGPFIRLKYGEFDEMCPITAVVHFKTGRRYHTNNYTSAGQSIKLPQVTMNMIVRAADKSLDFIRKEPAVDLRKRLNRLIKKSGGRYGKNPR